MEKKKKKKIPIPFDATKSEMDNILNKVDITKNPYIPNQPTSILKQVPKEYNPYAEKQIKAVKELNVIANQLTANAKLKVPTEMLHEMEQILVNALSLCVAVGKRAGLNPQLYRLFLNKVEEVYKATFLNTLRQRGVKFF